MNKKNYRTDLSQSSSRLRKKLLWSFLAILVTIGVLVALEKTGVTKFIKLHKSTPASSSELTAEQKQQADSASGELKKQLVDNDKGSPGSSSSNPASSESIDLSASTGPNNTITVFTTLKGYSDGTCLLTVTNGSKTTSQSASVIYQPQASSCAGFSVPIDPLGKGTWTINLAVTSKETTASKNINYEVK